MSIAVPLPGPPRAPRPRMTITAGPPSSGKSEWAASHRSVRPGFERVFLSRDRIRAELAGPEYLDRPVEPDVEDAVTARMRAMAEIALHRGDDVVLDGCNFHPLSRRQWKELAVASGGTFRVVVFDPPFETVAAANAERRQPRPEEVLRDSYDRWIEQRETLSTQNPEHEFI